MRSTRGFLYDLPAGKGVLVSDGSNVKMTTAPSGYVLTAKGTDEEPVFEQLPTVPNIEGGQAGAVLYQSAASTTTFSNTSNGVFAKNGSTPGFTTDVTMSSTNTMLTLNALSTQNSIVINGSNLGIGLQLRNPSNNTDFFFSKDPVNSHGWVTVNNNGTNHRWTYYTTGHFQLPVAQYASAPFLTTSSTGLMFKGSILPVSAGGTGSSGAITTTITVSRFGGNNLDSVTYTANTVTYEKIGSFVTLAFNIDCTLTVNAGGSCNLQIDLPITAAARALEHVYSTASGIVRTGRVGPGAYNKIQLLSTTGTLSSFSSGTQSFSGTFKLYSP